MEHAFITKLLPWDLEPLLVFYFFVCFWLKHHLHRVFVVVCQVLLGFCRFLAIFSLTKMPFRDHIHFFVEAS